VPFAELHDVVAPWLDHAVGGGPSNGIPPHVTLLAPAPADVEGIAEVLSDIPAFDVEFAELRRFDEAVWLAPRPSEPFVALTRALWERFPDWPPYEGRFLPDITPHLTVAWGSLLDEAEEAVAPALPLSARAVRAELIVEVEPRRWEVEARFPFRDA
jgi:hypothetical protein